MNKIITRNSRFLEKFKKEIHKTSDCVELSSTKTLLYSLVSEDNMLAPCMSYSLFFIVAKLLIIFNRPFPIYSNSNLAPRLRGIKQ